MVSVRHGSKLPGRSLACTPQTYVACNTSPDHACADVFALAVSQQHRELSRDYAMPRERLGLISCLRRRATRASGESTVSHRAAMCASLIRTTLIVNRSRKENVHAASPTDSRKNTTLSRRSHADHDRSPV